MCVGCSNGCACVCVCPNPRVSKLGLAGLAAAVRPIFGCMGPLLCCCTQIACSHAHTHPPMHSQSHQNNKNTQACPSTMLLQVVGTFGGCAAVVLLGVGSSCCSSFSPPPHPPTHPPIHYSYSTATCRSQAANPRPVRRRTSRRKQVQLTLPAHPQILHLTYTTHPPPPCPPTPHTPHSDVCAASASPRRGCLLSHQSCGTSPLPLHHPILMINPPPPPTYPQTPHINRERLEMTKKATGAGALAPMPPTVDMTAHNGLRGACAMWVVLGHCLYYYVKMNRTSSNRHPLPLSHATHPTHPPFQQQHQ